MFAGAEEKEEAKPNDVGDALITSVAADVLEEDVVDDRDWEWFDSSWQRVFSFVAAKLAGKAEIRFSVHVVAWVAGPHARKDLSHGADVLFHLSFADLLSLDGEFARLHAMRKKLLKGDGIGDVREVGVQVDSGA